ncbi:hypothetical protein K1719_041742 [Acacia pycnantha]|nr:hypothetical protein K1719_041742 [Acacia pycnantha]
MEEKVVETLKILDDEGDSFAKRAEMYYRKRPEIISFVEESFRAYKSLAEKYDHLSREFQSANRTIASCFPNELSIPWMKMKMKMKKKAEELHLQLMTMKAQQRLHQAFLKFPRLSKDAAISEIDKLQKEILTLQTEKEFVRSLYERSYEKHWEIEDQIEAMQKRVCCLQDVYGVGTVIEDNDARTLMAATALRSCQETLAKLQEIQAKSSKKLKHISHMDPEPHDGDKSRRRRRTDEKEEKASLEQEAQDVNQLREKIKEQLAGDSSRSLSGRNGREN